MGIQQSNGSDEQSKKYAELQESKGDMDTVSEKAIQLGSVQEKLESK